MSRCGRPGLWVRVRRLLGFGRDRHRVCGDWYDEPPGAFVREPRRPQPFSPAGTIMLELPRNDSGI